MPARAPSWFSGALLLSALACAPPVVESSRLSFWTSSFCV